MFKKDAFDKANKGASGDFGDTPSGVFIATLERAEIKDSTKPDSQSKQASFGWQISDDDETAPNRYVWWNQNVVKRNGEENEIGLNQFVQLLYKLSEGLFDPGEFEYNVAGECINADNVLDKFIGTQARINVKNKGKNSEGYEDISIKITRILENVYQSSNGKPQEQEIESPPFDGEAPAEEKGYDLAIGDAVVFESKGKQCRGRVQNYIDGAEKGKGMVAIKMTKADDDTFLMFLKDDAVMVSEESVFVIKDIPNLKGLDLPTQKRETTLPLPDNDILDEEILDEEPSLVLKKDGSATYTYWF